MNPGTVLATPSGTLYEYLRDGCATGWSLCGREHPITVFALDERGKRRFASLTVCMEASTLVPAEGWT